MFSFQKLYNNILGGQTMVAFQCFNAYYSLLYHVYS